MCRQDSAAGKGRRASHSKAPAAGGDEIGLAPGWTGLDATCMALPIVSSRAPSIFDPFRTSVKKLKYSLRKFLSPMDGKRVNHFCASKTVSDAARSQDILPQLLWQFCQMKMSSFFIIFISRFQV